MSIPDELNRFRKKLRKTREIASSVDVDEEVNPGMSESSHQTGNLYRIRVYQYQHRMSRGGVAGRGPRMRRLCSVGCHPYAPAMYVN